MKKLLLLACSIQPVLFASAASAQREEPAASTLEEVIITSSRVPLAKRKLGTSVSVLTAEQIEAHGNLALSDVLRQLPAIATSNAGGAGQPTSLRVRGEEGYRTLMILDGIRMLDPGGTQIGPQFEHQLSAAIGRVEVLRGPQGLGYGADAGGVINISSRRPAEGLQLQLDAQSGSMATRQYGLMLGGANEQADLLVNLQDTRTAGFNARSADTVLADRDGYANQSMHLRAGTALGEAWRLDAVYRQVDGESEFDGCWAGMTVHDCAADFSQQAQRLALSYNGSLVSHSLAYASTRTERTSYAAGQSGFGSDGELNRLEYLGSLSAMAGFELVFGADLESAEAEGRARENSGLFLEYISDFSEQLTLTAGLRHDDNEDFGSNLSYRLSGAYLFDLESDGSLKLRASLGTGFRAPSPFELAYNARPGGYPPASLVSLQQEESRGYELGLEYGRGKGMLELVYFDQDVRNAIVFDLQAYSGYIQDLGESRSRGVEFNSQFALWQAWQLSANYTYNDTSRPNGQPRLRRPRHLANFGLSYLGLRPGLQLNAFYRLAKGAVDELFGMAEPLALDDVSVLDVSARYQLSNSLQLYGRVENLLDSQYQELAGYNTAGRAAYLGFSWQYSSR